MWVYTTENNKTVKQNKKIKNHLIWIRPQFEII